jgi:hypothetical protein
MYMIATLVFVVAALLNGTPGGQETKPVPKDSVRVFVPGCAKGRMFTAGARNEEHAGGSPIPEGMRLRMSGPKKLMAEIKGQEGLVIEITGLMKKGQPGQGIALGRGVRITGGSSPYGGGLPGPGGGQIMIDVEGWRRLPGQCSAR